MIKRDHLKRPHLALLFVEGRFHCWNDQWTTRQVFWDEKLAKEETRNIVSVARTRRKPTGEDKDITQETKRDCEYENFLRFFAFFRKNDVSQGGYRR